VVRLKETFGDANDTGPRPLVVVDGVIMSDPDFLATLDPETIDRIEVVKGGAAEALYGERAAGGVIQIYTKR
jgi:TonB-dependent SusC/RagA subfamily outer membrane receptor